MVFRTGVRLLSSILTSSDVASGFMVTLNFREQTDDNRQDKKYLDDFRMNLLVLAKENTLESNRLYSKFTYTLASVFRISKISKTYNCTSPN